VQTLPRVWLLLKQSRLSQVICGAIIAAIIVAGGVWASHSQLFADATSLPKQQFTELYFTDPRTLPAHLAYGQSYTVRFTIANRSDKTQTYTYQTIIQTASAISAQDPVTVTVPAGKTTIQTVKLSTPVPNSVTLVHIGLSGNNQQIQFYAKP
jgi:uncharacterized membrane protein